MSSVRDQKPLREPFTIEDYNNKSPHSSRIEGGKRINDSFQKKSEPGKPIVSIVTVVFNSEAMLEQTILGVLNQTYENIEYIIIDGGSTDGTLSIIRKYEERIAYWMSEPDEGISDAFNKGIATSTGQLIGMINSGDWYCDNAVEVVVNSYKQREVCCIFHAKMQYWNTEMKPYYVFSGNDSVILYRSTVYHPTVFVPKEIYNEINLYRLDFKNAMDYEWLIRAKLQNKKFCYIDETISNMLLEGLSDKLWLRTYVETMQARHLHGMNPIKNFLLFIKITVLTLTRKAFECAGFNLGVRIYRKYFSIVRKEIA